MALMVSPSDIGATNLFVLSILLVGLLTMVGGGIVYFANLNRDIPNLDSPARVGWGLIVLSGILTLAAVVLYVAIVGLG